MRSDGLDSKTIRVLIILGTVLIGLVLILFIVKFATSDDGFSGMDEAVVTAKAEEQAGALGNIGNSASKYKRFSTEDFTCVVNADGTVTITGVGYKYTSSYKNDETELVIPSTIEGYRVKRIGNDVLSNRDKLIRVIISDGIEEVGSNVFFGCDNIESLEIPSSVKKIGSMSFAYCSSLKEVNSISKVTYIGVEAFTSTPWMEQQLANAQNGLLILGDNAIAIYCGNEAVVSTPKNCANVSFYGNKEITEVILSEGITKVDDRTFYECDSLTRVVIPNSVVEIGESAFYGCNKLTELLLPNSLEEIGASAFCSCHTLSELKIPQRVKNIGQEAFSGCVALKSINIPNGVSIINDNTFSYCRSLASVTLPDTISSLGNYAFDGCKSLRQIAIPKGVTSIGAGAFRKCQSLKSVDIPNGVTIIGEGAFDDCASLTKMVIPDNVMSLGSNAFSRCSKLASVELSEQITVIGDGLFSDCALLTNIELPKDVTIIGDGAFRGCKLLANITIPDNVATIGGHAFAFCDSLISIKIPNSVKTVGDEAFVMCYNLTIYCSADSYIAEYAKNHNISYADDSAQSLTISYIQRDRELERRIYEANQSLPSRDSEEFKAAFADYSQLCTQCEQERIALFENWIKEEYEVELSSAERIDLSKQEAMKLCWLEAVSPIYLDFDEISSGYIYSREQLSEPYIIDVLYWYGSTLDDYWNYLDETPGSDFQLDYIWNDYGEDYVEDISVSIEDVNKYLTSVWNVTLEETAYGYVRAKFSDGVGKLAYCEGLEVYRRIADAYYLGQDTYYVVFDTEYENNVTGIVVKRSDESMFGFYLLARRGDNF